ncbi:trypsin-like peptidase domain-containing protein [Teichococcus vastitatis]|uniref:trypsin-like peptidase domain-containing protein n=1 Tax=Teichococcus vastitatis TaxID=2307076 RepID=UPI000E77038C
MAVENRMPHSLRWLLTGVVGLTLAFFVTVARLGSGSPAEAMTSASAGVGGSAFLVGPGLLVTNTHVVLQCRALGRQIEVAGTPGSWRILAEEAGTDLALLAGPVSVDAPLPLSAAQRLPPDLPVLLLGYPTQGALPGILQGQAGHLRGAALTVHSPEAGRAVSFVMTDRAGQPVAARWEDGVDYFGPSQAERMRWQLEIDVTTGGGSSGGPVLDAVGNVVGVIYAGGRTGTAAVPLADLREFLARVGIAPAFQSPAGGRTPDWPSILQRAKSAMRRLAC